MPPPTNFLGTHRELTKWVSQNIPKGLNFPLLGLGIKGTRKKSMGTWLNNPNLKDFMEMDQKLWSFIL